MRKLRMRSMEDSAGDGFGRKKRSRKKHSVWERENTSGWIYISVEWLEVRLWSQAVWV